MRRLCWLFAALLACSERAPTAPTAASGSAPGDARDAGVALDPAIIARHWPDGCFTMRDASGKTVASDAARCALPRRPYSTFKLANALIAVDAGLLAGADAPMTWDRKAIPDEPGYRDAWRLPHTLRSGFAVSAVPYFRTLALQLGDERMHAGLVKLRYGNRDMAGGLSRFWLTPGKLRISADEQLAFVDALARGSLAVSARAQEVVRDISLLTKSVDDTAALHGKTGAGPIEERNGGWLVWQVGWVQRGAQSLPYAVWMESRAPDLDDARAARDQRLRATLTELGVFTWPAARP